MEGVGVSLLGSEPDKPGTEPTPHSGGPQRKAPNVIKGSQTQKMKSNKKPESS